MLEGARGTAPATATNTAAFQWFDQQFVHAYGQDPLNVANTFDAAMLPAVAAGFATQANRSLDGPTLAKALTMVSDPSGMSIPLDPLNFNMATSELASGSAINIEGASGPLDFDPSTGEAPGAIEVWTVADGGFSTLAVVSP
jgi:branched-chain amino acid transport system substrate-binding protein